MLRLGAPSPCEYAHYSLLTNSSKASAAGRAQQEPPSQEAAQSRPLSMHLHTWPKNTAWLPSPLLCANKPLHTLPSLAPPPSLSTMPAASGQPKPTSLRAFHIIARRISQLALFLSTSSSRTHFYPPCATYHLCVQPPFFRDGSHASPGICWLCHMAGETRAQLRWSILLPYLRGTGQLHHETAPHPLVTSQPLYRQADAGPCPQVTLLLPSRAGLEPGNTFL